MFNIMSTLQRGRSLMGRSFRIINTPHCTRPFATSILHSERVLSDKNSSSSATICFLHGLLGNGRNLKTFANKVCAQSQESAVLLDLRGHGKSISKPVKKPHSFENCVQDVKDTLEATETVINTMVGHSWGGRVALQYAASVDNLERLWLLDTVPGQANESVERVIRAVTSLQMLSEPILDRAKVVEILNEEHGLDMATAQWLASSLNTSTGSFGFDLDVVHGVWSEFAAQDFYGLLEEILTTKSNIRVDLVRGGANRAWTVDTLRQLESLQGPNFGIHVLPKAGHNVHIDDLPGLLQLMHSKV
jgi:pimeloyl-ACP methyl ester carboxylesterase